ncbi:MAG: NBR1-Ig-like domain-containing protein [Patescibacteria group bacterium]
MPSVVSAAPLKGYEALQSQAPGKISMQPGETKTVSISFQNIGTTTWTNSGSNFVSIYTYNPKYRSSVFKSSSWMSASQAVKLKQTSVAPKAVGTIELPLTAPKTPGAYVETFHLAAEDKAWIPGGEFTVNITVGSATSTTTSSTTTTTSQYQAEVTSMSEPKITAKGGVSVVYTVTVKNAGKTNWGTHALTPSEVHLATVSASDIQHKSWKSSSTILERATSVAPGSSETLSFAFLTPKYKGSYTLAFDVTVNGENAEGGEIYIPVEVTADAPDVQGTSKTKETTSETKSTTPYTENIVTTEPTMRVGILIVDEETDNEVVISGVTAMRVEDTDGNLLANVDAGEEVTAYYMTDKKKYYYEIDGETRKTSLPIRFVPVEANTVLTITNFDRRVTRGSAYADNQFRNILEIRYNETKDRTWMINELPFSWYSKGSAETSGASHMEFKKALMIAWNTYAYTLATKYTTKHDEEGFIADAYADQVYKGYGNELRTSQGQAVTASLSQAVDETRGIIVTYNGEVAITPYFSRSDGRTRDWSEVWGGDIPWCQGVEVPEDAGKTLWGHGVGMSASGALQMANDGKTYDQILKHFYTGVELQKMWE